MTTTLLEPTWTTIRNHQPALSPFQLSRSIVPPQPQVRCPICNAVIYCRRHKHCGVCAEELPETVRFTESEALKVEAVVQFERRQHRAWMRKEQSW